MDSQKCSAIYTPFGESFYFIFLVDIKLEVLNNYLEQFHCAYSVFHNKKTLCDYLFYSVFYLNTLT
jgi:hypothetical protein